MKRRLFVAVLTGLALLAIASSSFAQAPAAGGGVRAVEGEAKSKDQGYGYEFADDPLAAGGFGPNDATIRVRQGPVRVTLIRPRISFVDQMLKSVENL